MEKRGKQRHNARPLLESETRVELNTVLARENLFQRIHFVQNGRGRGAHLLR
jgi:hypothetical protein